MRTIHAAALSALVGLMAGAASAEKPAEPAKATVQRAEKPETKSETVRREPSERMTAQQEAMKALAFLDGEWRGTSKTKRKEGWVAAVQTERVTTLVGGTLKQIEVRGFDSNGAQTFEALRIISYDPGRKAYVMRSYQGGGVRDHVISVKPDGYSWEIGGGRSAVRYDATVRNGVWTETATRLSEGEEPDPYFEFTVRRAKPGVWPAVAALAAK